MVAYRAFLILLGHPNDRSIVDCRAAYAVAIIFRGLLLAPSVPLTEIKTMDMTRCSACKKRLMAMTDRIGRTTLVCLKCDNIDPMKTDAAKWANSSLANLAR